MKKKVYKSSYTDLGGGGGGFPVHSITTEMLFALFNYTTEKLFSVWKRKTFFCCCWTSHKLEMDLSICNFIIE